VDSLSLRRNARLAKAMRSQVASRLPRLLIFLLPDSNRVIVYSSGNEFYSW
jgi:hypothetical protein